VSRAIPRLGLPRRPAPFSQLWTARRPPRRIVEDPEGLGYRLVADPLLELMDAAGWYALERAAVARPHV
jgi:hypothetical protein